MASTQFKQYRFFDVTTEIENGEVVYKGENSRNTPAYIGRDMITSASIFTGSMNVRRLGVQSLPGVKFFLNNQECVIGASGVWELDLTNYPTLSIESFRIDAKSLEIISDNPDAYLIIDTVYLA